MPAAYYSYRFRTVFCIDGSQVSAVYYNDNNVNRIAKYCSKDVVVTAQLLLKLNQQPAIKQENIYIIE